MLLINCGFIEIAFEPNLRRMLLNTTVPYPGHLAESIQSLSESIHMLFFPFDDKPLKLRYIILFLYFSI